MKNYISQNIKYLRSEKNMDQSMLAGAIGVKNDNVSAYEREKAQPKIETLQRIGQHFNINLDDFINRDLRDIEKSNNLVNEDTLVYEVAHKDEKIQLLETQVQDKMRIIAMQDAELKIYKQHSKKQTG